ncbi:hypothetical protein CRYUN_Cryun33cG0023900 [Craigia yunnanensis]
MAILCASTSAIFSSLERPSFTSLKRIFPVTKLISWILPVVALSKPSSVRTTTLSFSKPDFRVCYQDLSLVPENQRWMFEESEADGPSLSLSLSLSFLFHRLLCFFLKFFLGFELKFMLMINNSGKTGINNCCAFSWKEFTHFTPSVDMGAFVIVVNAEKVAVSGKKRTQKLYRRHSGRPGGMKRIPERIIEHAVRGMLPKGRLGRALFNHLKDYKGPDHPHEAQKSMELPIRDKWVQLKK